MPDVDDRAFTVELRRSGLEVEVPAGSTILETLRPLVTGLSWNCLDGVCGTCTQTILDGVPDHRDTVLSPRAKQAGKRITICVSRSRTDTLVLDL
ncbi:2Fe-2S iron-sulfur cluster-binding protein [Nocardioides zeae]|uniref:Ferredoxin n=1 Tax=Nocardioides zeae TaxID=1457234 RepID=A0AAJ1TWI3_9ACTN|nr:2Fe-2S iron-sulfur cluster binding domain-containing protein [Nocardioides zeae]MDQ1103606.1 ferredoxin [Nocardioides zeae]